MVELSLIALTSPLIGGLLSGFFGSTLGKWFTNGVTILSVLISFLIACLILFEINSDPSLIINQDVYTWLSVGNFHFTAGILIDHLTVSMMAVVTFVSLVVHIYTIGYMRQDPGYHRFFSYISLFTFAMLTLVISNNFLQLFFAWEAVGVMSYLLIGFWYTKESAIKANFKAFIVNRVGDMGFLLGIALIFSVIGSLDYQTVFTSSAILLEKDIVIASNTTISALTLACLLLFIGAMGKSAQMPLHVWLPDSMEGPTPISALIHAATMVTAGVYMIARMSPLFELSSTALSVVLIIGATTALLTGLLGIVEFDIKRIIAYSTLSQLGYMVVAAGVSAYSASIFHLMTHAFFKALLFLAAGSVIIALHHEQDIRKMGGLRRLMPYTYVAALIGSLSLIGFPGFSGFFSKDALIEAVAHSDAIGAEFAYFAVMIGVFVTALYTFRLLFRVFHGQLSFQGGKIKESPMVIIIPLVLLSIPSIIFAWPTVGDFVYGNFFADSIRQMPSDELFGYNFTDPTSFLIHTLSGSVVYLSLFGVLTAWFFYIYKPDLPEKCIQFLKPIHTILWNKYYFDYFYEKVIAKSVTGLGSFFWNFGDIKIIDDTLVNGTANTIAKLSAFTRRIQTGYIYHYALMMMIGLSVFLAWAIIRS